MSDLFGIDVGHSAFDHRRENHVGTIDELFKEEMVVQDNCFYHSDNIKFIYLGGDDMLLVLKNPASLYFRGVLSVKCLLGQVEINGFIIRDISSESHYVYSLCSHSALCFTSLDTRVSDVYKLQKVLGNIRAGHLFNELSEELPISCLLVVSRHELNGFEGLSETKKNALLPKRRFYSGTIYFSDAEECLNCIFDVATGNRINGKMVGNLGLNSLVEELTFHNAPRVAVCGGKGVGKSTSLRYLTNQLLSFGQDVLFIDFDIGQPEFTVPGCISVTLVSKPLLGPSYTHITTPLRSIFLGFVNADLCLDSYSEGIKDLHAYCEGNPELQSIPWFINTMGYIKGCGLLLLNEILTTFKLSHVLQLHSAADFKFTSSLLKSPLRINDSHSFVDLNPRSAVKSILYNPSSNAPTNLTPRSLRELMVLFYFYNFKTELRRHEIKRKHSDSRLDEQSADLKTPESLLRGDVVAVCSSKSTISCIGFGVVESCHDNTLVILTPLEPSVFNDAHILRAELELSSNFSTEILPSNIQNEMKSCVVLIEAANTRCPSLFSYFL